MCGVWVWGEGTLHDGRVVSQEELVQIFVNEGT